MSAGSEPGTSPNLPIAPIPHCPNCDAELAAMGFYNWVNGGWLILCCYCTACLSGLHFQVAPMMVRAEDPEEGKVIHHA